MLVLTRRPNESLLIHVPPSDRPQVIAVQVLRSSPRVTSLGIEAPREILVLRKELERGLSPGLSPGKRSR